MNDRDERLRQFFGGWFHQDWDADGATTWQDVVNEFLAQYPIDHARIIRDDLRSWLSDATGGLPPAFACDYDPRPDGLDERAWVMAIADHIDRRCLS